MFWVYGVVPHQWLTWADGELQLARRQRIIVEPGDVVGHVPVHDHATRRSRDIIVVGIYGVGARRCTSASGRVWQNRGKKKPDEVVDRPTTAARW